MSRSNPNENGTPNPSTRWFEWNGEHGVIRYYDKEAERNVDIGDDFTFMLLDQLGTVKGWHDASDSGIYANEVKDTRADVLVVKSFKGGPIAEGFYKDIKDRVNAEGGQFVASCYIAYKGDDGTLQIGNLRFKGAALREWMEFTKAHRSEVYKKAVRIKGSTEGKKGRVIFKTPNLHITDITPQTDVAATALDRELQEFLKVYLKKNKRDQADSSGEHIADEDIGRSDMSPAPSEDPPMEAITDDDIPF